MEEIIEVKFANDESDFIHNRGVNRGYGQVPCKIARCYFLSDSARCVYLSLSQYLYGNKRECYPGRETIKQELGGWGNNRLDNAIDELEQEKIIERKKRDGKNTTYTFLELQYSFVLAHSELIHEIRYEYQRKGKQSKFYKALTAYRRSGLKDQVEAARNLSSFIEAIQEWFRNEIEETKQEESESVPSIEETDPEPAAAPRGPRRPLPPVITTKSDYSTKGEPGEEKEKPKPKGRNHEETDLPEWNVHHFYSYFRALYLQHQGAAYPANKGDLASLKHIITQNNDKLFTKSLLDTYFKEIASKGAVTPSVFNFSSAFVQQKLHSLLNSNRFTSNKDKSKSASNTSQDVSKEWINQYLQDE